MTTAELKSLAISMMSRAYAPYSHFTVGAALECEDGSVFTGCNIENAAYGPTLCAERTAASKAISEGHFDFKRIFIAGCGPDFCYPCGVCRQFLYEFAPDMEVICINKDGDSMITTLRDLLPCGFRLEKDS